MRVAYICYAHTSNLYKSMVSSCTVRSCPLPAVILSPSAMTTLMSCGFSWYTFCAGLVRGGSWGQEKFTGNCACALPHSREKVQIAESSKNEAENRLLSLE